MRAFIASAAFAAFSVFYVNYAYANAAGISGSSGKTGSSCDSCHTGNGHGPAPMVTFVGPTSLVPGQTATYEMDIVSSASLEAHGIDIAISSGTLGTVAQTLTTHLASGEVTQSAPSSGSTMTAWKFSVTAPSSSGTITLFGSGLSGNGDGGTFGDTSVAITQAITVAPPPDMTVPPDLVVVRDLTVVPDLVPEDLIGADFTPPPPDLAPPPDLTVDAVSSASKDMVMPAGDAAMQQQDLAGADFAGVDAVSTASAPKPKANEATWACGCRVGARSSTGSLALLGMALLGGALAIRRRRRD